MPRNTPKSARKVRTSVISATGRQPLATAPPADNRRLWFVALGLCVLTLAVFLQVAHFDFINYDDGKYVYEHPIITKGLTLEGIKYAFTSYSYFYWQPVTWLSHMLDCQLFGSMPAGIT